MARIAERVMGLVSAVKGDASPHASCLPDHSRASRPGRSEDAHPADAT
jgi:hypothetical protein